MPKDPDVTIRVPERTPFDKSHKWFGTGLVGTLVPILVDEVIGNTKVKAKLALSVKLPPLASDTYLNLDYKVEAFFVPLRLCFGSAEDWMIQGLQQYISWDADSPTDPEVTSIIDYTPTIPFFTQGNDPSDVLMIQPIAGENIGLQPWYAPHTLADYLGFKDPSSAHAPESYTLAPFVAYGLVYEYWYRRSDIQQRLFVPSDAEAGLMAFGAAHLPYWRYYRTTSGWPCTNTNKALFYLADGESIFSLRQRNFGFDYFTNALPSANGGDMEVTVSSNKFSISQLRQANSMQQWLELNQLPGRRYSDILKARYNANLKDGVAQKPIFLGSASYDVYNRGVSVQANNVGSAINNPFADYAGGKLGNAYGSGSDFIIDGFVAQEPGYIMVLGSLVPKVNYSSGIRRYLRHYAPGLQSSITDMASYMLQNVGNQPIYMSELDPSCIGNSAFGYTDRYGEWMNMESQVHGLYQSGQSLASFVAQRSFNTSGVGVNINSKFLRIPTTYLDDVTAVTSYTSEYGYELAIDWDYKVTMPLYQYSLPSLQNPAYEHGDAVKIHRGGFRF